MTKLIFGDLSFDYVDVINNGATIELPNDNEFQINLEFYGNNCFRVIISYNYLNLYSKVIEEIDDKIEVDIGDFARAFLNAYPQYKYSLNDYFPNIEDYLIFS